MKQLYHLHNFYHHVVVKRIALKSAEVCGNVAQT